MRNNLVFVLLAAVLVLVTVAAVGLAFAYPTISARPAPTPTFEPFVLPTLPASPAARRPVATRTALRYTYCPECQSTGQAANVWADAAMSSVACRLPWGTQVAVLQTGGGMALVSGGGCRGWMRTSLPR